MIPITRSPALADDEIEAAFTRAQGPGGQHVSPPTAQCSCALTWHSPSPARAGQGALVRRWLAGA